MRWLTNAIVYTIFAIGAVFTVVNLALLFGAIDDVVTGKNCAPAEPRIWTDAFTGKQYVVNPAGGIWARVNDQGRHMDMWEQPR
jgi:hypothetical protein